MSRNVQFSDVESVYALRNVVWHASQPWIAFVVQKPSLQLNANVSYIHVAQVTNAGLADVELQEWKNDVVGESPQWLPHIGSLSVIVPTHGLVVYDLLSGTQTSYEFPGMIGAYAWAPNGHVVVAEGVISKSSPEELMRTISAFPYQKDGQGFTYHQSHQLFRLDIDEGAWTPMTDDRSYNYSQPQWSPDGKDVVCIRTPRERRTLTTDLVTRDPYALPSVNADRVLSSNLANAAHPVWSPDSRHIAFVAATHPDRLPEHRRIWCVPREGGPVIGISGEYDRTVAGESCDWIDEHTVGGLFEDDGTTVYVTFSIDADRVIKPLLSPDHRYIHEWAWTLDRTQAIIVSSDPTTPPELYQWRLGDEAPKRLSHLHDMWRSAVALADIQRIPAGAGGVSVPTWLMRPPQFTSTNQYPGVVTIHGGPYAQFSYAFSLEHQMWASHGYIVIFGNPRGSSGYNESWAKSLGGDRGGIDFQDLLSELDGALAVEPSIDRERVIVQGSSYGGYLTLWAVTHTDRFCAAIAEAAPANLYSMSGTGDQAGLHHRLLYGATAQENPEFYLAHSPITYAEQAAAPILLLHGELDHRVPVQQSQEMFTALWLAKKDVQLIQVQGVSHTYARTGPPQIRYERWRRIFEWCADRANGRSFK